MKADPDQVRRSLINASGAALLSNILPINPASAQAAEPDDAPKPAERSGDRGAVSPITAQLAAYVSGALDRELPEAVAATTKLHVLDTIAAMVSGRRLRPGEIAARYVESLGGKPVATVIATGIMTSPVNAALANAMAAHADETDDTHPFGPFHAGCSAVPAALATAEMAGRSGKAENCKEPAGFVEVRIL